VPSLVQRERRCSLLGLPCCGVVPRLDRRWPRSRRLDDRDGSPPKTLTVRNSLILMIHGHSNHGYDVIFRVLAPGLVSFISLNEQVMEQQNVPPLTITSLVGPKYSRKAIKTGRTSWNGAKIALGLTFLWNMKMSVRNRVS
jgi:hypothetical protein